MGRPTHERLGARAIGNRDGRFVVPPNPSRARRISASMAVVSGHPDLTERQREVVREVARHGSRKEAARDLGVTEHAVHRCMGRMRERCGCTSEAQAMLMHADEVMR